MYGKLNKVNQLEILKGNLKERLFQQSFFFEELFHFSLVLFV